MAATYNWGDLLIMTSQNARRDPNDALAADACNLAMNFIWNKADWREAMAELPPFWLIPNEQDHGAPAATVPSDFLGLRRAWVVNTQAAGIDIKPLRVQRGLDRTQWTDIPRLIEYNSEMSAFRLWPRVPLSYTATTYLVDGAYKKKPTKITAASLHDTRVPWDDLYLSVFLASLKWAFMLMEGNPNAGQVTVNNRGQRTFTGQLGVVETLIRDMMEKEGVNLGNPAIAPSQPLALGGYANSVLIPG